MSGELMDCDLCDDKPFRFYPKGKCPKFKWRICRKKDVPTTNHKLY